MIELDLSHCREKSATVNDGSQSPRRRDGLAGTQLLLNPVRHSLNEPGLSEKRLRKILSDFELLAVLNHQGQ